MLDHVPTYLLFVHHDGLAMMAISGVLFAVLPLVRSYQDQLGPYAKPFGLVIVAVAFLLMVVGIVHETSIACGRHRALSVREFKTSKVGRAISFILTAGAILIYGLLVAIASQFIHLLPGGEIFHDVLLHILFLPAYMCALLISLVLLIYALSSIYSIFRSASPLPCCPKCGNKLKSDKAKQCLSCGYDWHQQDSPA
ncbi:hypothetical protein GC197_11635 [bacterium]|nr:hypothetical protein [bacterium]